MYFGKTNKNSLLRFRIFSRKITINLNILEVYKFKSDVLCNYYSYYYYY